MNVHSTTTIVFTAISYYAIASLFVTDVSSQPIDGKSKGGAFYYLANYGYIQASKSENTAQLLSEEVLTKAIKDFQSFAGLDPTGELDDETVEKMNTPRCGVRDMVGPSTNARRRKRYALQGSRWSVKRLTYRITKYPSTSRLKKWEVDDEIKKAFEIWSKHSDLKFEEKKSGSVHIEIRFEKKEHGDGDPFDGPGGTLAHAFFPIYGGDAHFDDQEYWTIDDYRGSNLLQTMAHEFGHSLGLSHSDDSSALMAPFYKGYQPDVKLEKDDIKAIQALYGKSNGNKPSRPSNPTRPSSNGGGGGGNNKKLCSDPRVDAMFSTSDGSYYVFKGREYYKLTDDSIAPGYPRKIRDDWGDDAPIHVDAAVTWPDNESTYIFKGSKYWKYKADKTPAPGYPKDIDAHFPGIPDNVDAAFVWGGNGKIYFFKGGQYWKFDPKKKPPVNEADYPRKISNWDLPNNIDAAIQWKNKYTYFFHDGEYYRFDDKRFQIDKGDPAFPRPSGVWWFGCKSANLKGGSSVTNYDGDDYNDDDYEDDGKTFFTRFLQKKDEVVNFFHNFDEADDTMLDVFSGDE